MADGQTVVVDLDNLAHRDTEVLAELLADGSPKAGQLRLVAGRAEGRGTKAAPGTDPRIETYPSVDVALADRVSTAGQSGGWRGR